MYVFDMHMYIYINIYVFLFGQIYVNVCIYMHICMYIYKHMSYLYICHNYISAKSERIARKMTMENQGENNETDN
jgi:hypothetical protein